MSDEQIRGDQLIERILTIGDADGKLSNELVGEFHRHDYPVEKLIPLLRSDDNEIVRTGAFLAEELGAKATPLLPELARLLDDPDIWVKSGVLTAVLASATDRDGVVVGGVVSLITDESRPVRKMVFEILTRVDLLVLAAGIPYIDDRKIAGLMEWVLEVESESCDHDEIRSRLEDSDGLSQLFATVAAARVHGRNPHYLQHAASVSESDSQSLAASELAWLSKLDDQARRRQERAERRDD